MPRKANRPADDVGVSQPAVCSDVPPFESREAGPSRRVLVIAYYFPPMGLSGVQRTAKFVKFLPKFGWQPTVLTCEPRGYYAFDDSLWAEIQDAGIDVIRARGWDPTRLYRKREVMALPSERRRRWISALSQFFFIPDNKIGWYRAARMAGTDAHRREPFDVIFSTAPPYTAHLVGCALSRRLGVPLVLDFRDDWIGNPRHSYPTPIHRSLSTRLEQKAIQSCRRVIVINDYIRRNLLARNADIVSSENVSVISQGFDPEDFEGMAPVRAESDRFTLLYSGVFYDAQTPEFFLRALADLLTRRADLRGRIDAVFAGLLPGTAMERARELGVQSVVRHTGYLPHEELVQHLLAADALWMTVGRQEGAETISTSKLFEYFGARKPVLGLVPRGAAREALSRYGAAEIVEPDSVAEISAAIGRLYDAWERGELPVPDDAVVKLYDRVRLTRRLHQLFESVLQESVRV